MDNSKTVLVASRNAEDRRSLSSWASARGYQTVEYPSTLDLIRQLHDELRGVVVADPFAEDASPPEIQRHLGRRPCPMPLIVWTEDQDISRAVGAFRSGVFDFVQKHQAIEDLWNSIEHALAHEAAEYDRYMQEWNARQKLHRLNASEFDVLKCLLDGLGNKQIAVQLDIGLRTVEHRRARIMTKTECESLPELVRLTIVAGTFHVPLQ